MKPLQTPLAFLITLALWVLALPTIFAQEEDLNTLNQEISKLAGAGKFKEALPIAERAVEVSKRTHGLEDPTTANSLDNLGQLFLDLGDFSQAERLFQQALAIQEKILPPEDPKIGLTVNDWPSFTRIKDNTTKPWPIMCAHWESGRKSFPQRIASLPPA